MVSLPQSAKNKDTKDIQLDNTYLYGDEDSNYFDKMFPILMSFFVFLFVFLISGIALLRERTTGTIERVLATPIKRSEIVFGYLIGYGIFAIIQTLIIVLFSIYLLNINLAGSLAYVILINILLAIAISNGNFHFDLCKFRISNDSIHTYCCYSTGILFWNLPIRKYVTMVK